MDETTALMSGWLADVPADMAERLIAIGRMIEIPQGDVVFSLGSDSADFYGVAGGTVRLEMAQNGNEQHLAQFLGPGFWFGELGLVIDQPRMMGATAATDLRLMQISQIGFRRLAKEIPEIWRWIALLSIQHLAIAIGAADDLMLNSAEKRIAAVLLRFTGRRHANPLIRPNEMIPVTQQEFATAAGMSRASAGQILRQMASQGYITIEYGSLVILDPEALAAIILD